MRRNLGFFLGLILTVLVSGCGKPAVDTTQIEDFRFSSEARELSQHNEFAQRFEETEMLSSSTKGVCASKCRQFQGETYDSCCACTKKLCRFGIVGIVGEVCLSVRGGNCPR